MQTIDLTDVEFDLIVATMDQDELKCESRHTATECSREVLYITDDRCAPNDHRKVCQSHADYVMRRKAEGTRCGDCKRPTRECWSVRPI